MNALHSVWGKLIPDLIKDKYETQSGQKADRWRPLLHIAPPFGWLNDPNGLCQYEGVYHAFYQMAPFDAEGGLKFWGHCTSRDLLHWTFEGIPLMPDESFDCHGAYSGSALAEEGELLVFYTGNIKLPGEYDFINEGREANTALAVSRDGGKTFESKELLMTNGDYPADMSRHVRDPKVWKRDGMYYMVQGGRTREDKGVVLLFSSEDKRHWKYLRRLEYEKSLGYMWECPDLYVLDGHTILSFSPQGVKQEGLLYANRYQSGTCVVTGDFCEDYQKDAVLGEFLELDGGFDFYAPQSFQAEDGRRIQIGWMGMPDAEEEYTNRSVEDGWQHTLTIPRELSVRDGVLCQNPVQELDSWWNRKEYFEGNYEGSTNRCCELRLETAGDVKVALSGGLLLEYRKSDKTFWMKFTDESLGAGRGVRGRRLERLADMRILVDVSCVEVFLNGGEEVFSTRFYPEENQYNVKIQGESVTGSYLWHV